MKKSIFIFLFGLLAFGFNVQANADIEFSIKKKSGAENVYQLFVKSTNVDQGMDLEVFPGNTLSQFRLTVKVSSGSANSFGTTTSAHTSLNNLESSSVNYGSFDYITYFANPNVSVGIPADGSELVLLEFAQLKGSDVPVLWDASLDPQQVDQILIYNAYMALSENSENGSNNYKGNYNVNVETVNTAEIGDLQDIRIFPNPAKGQTIISGVNSTAAYYITSKNGSLISSGNLLKGDNELDVSLFAPGIYYIGIQGESKTRNLPLVVIK